MIGRACAEVLDKAGYSLILLGKEEPSLKSMKASLQSAYVYAVNFLDSIGLQDTMVNILKKHKIDGFLYNVATYPWGPLEELSQEDFNKTLHVTLNAAFTLTKFLIPSFKNQKSGKIIYISSLGGEVQGVQNMAAYCAGKAGLNGLMRTCALELGPYEVTVNSILPGQMYDPLDLSEVVRKEKLKKIPLKRFIKPTDIAYMAQYLLSKKADNITGQTFVVDGGQSIC